MGDSFYEYLLKQWLFTGKQEARYWHMYNATLAGLMHHLVVRTPRRTYVAERRPDGKLHHKMDHLVWMLSHDQGRWGFFPDGTRSKVWAGAGTRRGQGSVAGTGEGVEIDRVRQGWEQEWEELGGLMCTSKGITLGPTPLWDGPDRSPSAVRKGAAGVLSLWLEGNEIRAGIFFEGGSVYADSKACTCSPQR